MEYHGVEYRPRTVFLKRLRDLALLAGFSFGFMWLVTKLGALCPTVLEHFAISSIFELPCGGGGRLS